MADPSCQCETLQLEELVPSMWQANLAEAAAFSGDRNFAVSHPAQPEMAAYPYEPEI